MATFSYQTLARSHTLQLHQPAAFHSGLHSQLFMHFWDGFHLAVFYWSSCKTINSGLTVSLPRVGPELTFLVLAELS